MIIIIVWKNVNYAPWGHTYQVKYTRFYINSTEFYCDLKKIKSWVIDRVSTTGTKNAVVSRSAITDLLVIRKWGQKQSKSHLTSRDWRYGRVCFRHLNRVFVSSMQWCGYVSMYYKTIRVNSDVWSSIWLRKTHQTRYVIIFLQ